MSSIFILPNLLQLQVFVQAAGLNYEGSSKLKFITSM